MKKKVVGSLVAVALIALLTFMLVGCTVSGTYTSVLSTKTTIKFSGSGFTYSPAIGNEIKGKFEGAKIAAEDKEKVEAALTLANLDKDALKGKLVLKNEDGEEFAVGFYGKDKDGKNYVVIIGSVTGVFTK